MASLHFSPLSSSLQLPRNPTAISSTLKSGGNEVILLRFSTNSSKKNRIMRGTLLLRSTRRISSILTARASTMPPEVTKEAESTKDEALKGSNPLSDMKQRFLQFKRDKYLANVEHFQTLAENQAPKFTVIACADSRVCPSNILGFQPGEAFVVRNVANLVPPFESGPTETKAALEFSVNTLQVENILIIGHSCCGGIQALMSMQDEEDSRSFIRSWVTVGKNAKLSTKSVASNLNFDQQCRHCEKESINRSLMNLLTYPWIKERVAKGELCLHGGYYDFTVCTFEKWTLDYEGIRNTDADGSNYSIKDRELWQ